MGSAASVASICGGSPGQQWGATLSRASAAQGREMGAGIAGAPSRTGRAMEMISLFRRLGSGREGGWLGLPPPSGCRAEAPARPLLLLLPSCRRLGHQLAGRQPGSAGQAAPLGAIAARMLLDATAIRAVGRWGRYDAELSGWRRDVLAARRPSAGGDCRWLGRQPVNTALARHSSAARNAGANAHSTRGRYSAMGWRRRGALWMDPDRQWIFLRAGLAFFLSCRLCKKTPRPVANPLAWRLLPRRLDHLDHPRPAPPLAWHAPPSRKLGCTAPPLLPLCAGEHRGHAAMI
jgi:hypothetical protein